MHVLVAPDAFKGTLTAAQVSEAIAEGLRGGGATVDECPAADGGEGTLAALTSALRLSLHEVDVHDALGRSVQAPIGLGEDGCAVIETAAAIGIAQLNRDELHPLLASSRGAGELIGHALDAGAERLLVCVGGSATVDGGQGALEGIDDLAAFRRARVEVLCDVETPFERAAAVYGPQKGASATDVALLSSRLEDFAATLPRDPRGRARTGAAGGLSGALWAHGATLSGGAERVLGLLELDRRLAHAELLVTGEGRLDAQTTEGKLVAVVARRAHALGVPVVAVVGQLAAGEEVVRELALTRVLVAGTPAALTAAGAEIAEAMAEGETAVARTAMRAPRTR
ncbi:MAG TPA: glycerate kinase [Solirubrobacteraceae bacterium]|jgi:glycerate kinase|nr:glycerate kinase [Solirubrobacteraceae bacterium]